MSAPHPVIREAFGQLRREARLRHRDIAEKLNLSEGELIAAHVGNARDTTDSPLQATRLRAEWPALIEALEPLGVVMALTRNAHCVHEKTGVYRKASHHGQMGLVLGGDIDLRLFYAQWAHGFAVSEDTDKGSQRSLQFFDASGMAIHKIFLRPESHLAAYFELVEQFRAEDQHPGLTPIARPSAEPEQPDSHIDIEAFRQGWASLRDTHEFFGLLKRFAVSRTQGLRLADPRFAQQVDLASAQEVLNAAAQENVSIMVFVGNAGMIQIHTGTIGKVVVMGPWLNVLDPGFSMHLREDQIASAWVVRKPTIDGMVTSLELFDAHGDTIAMFFGERKPGKPELCEWRGLIDRLLHTSPEVVCAA